MEKVAREQEPVTSLFRIVRSYMLAGKIRVNGT